MVGVAIASEDALAAAWPAVVTVRVATMEAVALWARTEVSASVA